jgi:P27 family predicted phage terminase small subunit
MAKRGPRPQPDQLQALHGAPGHRKKHARVDGVGMIAPPDWLDAEQLELWQHAVVHAPPGILSDTDRETLALWVTSTVEYRRCLKALGPNGRKRLVRSTKGTMMANPLAVLMHRHAMVALRCCGELGFSPASRADLGLRMTAADPLAPLTEREVGSSVDDLRRYLSEAPDPTQPPN